MAQVIDFVGLFGIWFLISVLVLLVNYAPKCCVDRVARLHRACLGRMDKAVKASTGIDIEHKQDAETVDNEAAMLRKLLKQMADVQGEIAEVKSGMEKTSAAVTAAAQEGPGRRRRTLQKNDSAADIKGTLNGD